MNCIITSLKSTIIHEKVLSIILPTTSGEMEILNNYAESFMVLKAGNIIIRKNKETKSVPVISGECYIKDNNIIIIL